MADSKSLSPADVQWLFERLREIDFLMYHSEDELTELVRSITKLRAAPGERVIRQGQAGSAYFIIRGGTASVWAETPDGPRRLASLGEGDSFGEVSILTGEVCNASVKAEGPLDLFALPPGGLRAVAKANPVLAEKMSDTIAARKGVRALGLEPVAAGAPLRDRIKGFFGIA